MALLGWIIQHQSHSAIQTNPFEALYGYDPSMLQFFQQESTNVLAVDQFLKERRIVSQLLKENLSGTTQIQKICGL